MVVRPCIVVRFSSIIVSLALLPLNACGASGHGSPEAGTPPGGDAGPPEAGDAPAGPGAAPLGASWAANDVRFRVRADAALAVELDVYTSPRGADEVARYAMTRSAPGAAWAVDLSRDALAAVGITSVVYYGYRAWGANWPPDPAWTKGSDAGFVSDVDSQGNRYNPNKLLIDPYTHEISHDPLQADSSSSAPYTTGPASRDVDDGKVAPKSVAWASDVMDVGTPPSRALKDDVIYEVQLRGLTMNDPSVDPALRGTYAGAATKAGALAALGVTAVEFLPVHETQNDRNDADPGNANYWGYSTLAYFAPDRRFAADKSPGGPTREFASMVKAFHARGVKVILDVVYNHTAEGGVSKANVAIAKIYSFRGLDNAAYYELAADRQTPVDNTGVGGNFNTANGIVRDLVIDSLKYWHEKMGVDGFRFDLGVVLGNSCTSDCYKFQPDDPNGILQRAVQESPARNQAGGAGVDLIAEPWANGTGTYQLGHFPPGWSEWNGTFRDSIRSGQNVLGSIDLGTLAAKLAGSPDLFRHDGRSPSASINYVDCHDGFTLNDVYAYNVPDNSQPYPYGPSPGGSSTNYSWDQDASAPAQLQAIRTGMALVVLSAGVPMIQGGDEFRRTQRGNNNAYNLDNSANWLDWSQAAANPDLVAWTTGLFALRREHAAFRPASYRDGTDHDSNGLPDVIWLDAMGAVAGDAYLKDKANHFLAFRLDGQEAGEAVRSIYVAWNGGDTSAQAMLPAAGSGTAWYVVGDSASGRLAASGQETALGGKSIAAAARSVVILVER
jgi:glycogen operon protein